MVYQVWLENTVTLIPCLAKPLFFARMFNKNSVCCIVYCMNEYKLIEKDEQLKALVEHWHEEGILTVAMDFEGEFNLHIYGEHLCLVQLFDRKDFYIVDAMKVSGAALKVLLESDIEKIMFDCSGTAPWSAECTGLTLPTSLTSGS